MDQHHPSFPNPSNTRFPPPIYTHQHQHHHHHLPPLPRLPPAPPPHIPHQSPISLPPPPHPPPNSFHHHHYHNNNNNHNSPQRIRYQQQIDPNLSNHHHHHHHQHRNQSHDFSQQPPRVTDRLVYDDDRRSRPLPQSRGYDDDPYRRQINGPVVWDHPPPRVLIDAPPPQPLIRRISRPVYDCDHPPYKPSFQVVDRFRNEQDGGSRVKKEGNSDVWFRVEDLPRERRRDDRFDRREKFVSPKVEQFHGPVPQEELIRNSRGLPYSPTDLRNRVVAPCSSNGFREKHHVLDSKRLGDKDRWDDAQDFDLTPRKKQKKNALLRIQPPLPSFKNSYERSPGLCKDKETEQIPDDKPTKEREMSPIVSFKSNLLIVASSSSGVVADEKSALDDGKNRNEMVDNKDDLVLPSNAVEKVQFKTDSDNHCENGPCSSEKKPKSPNNLKKVKPSVSNDPDPPVGNSEAPSHKILSDDKKPSLNPNGKVVLKFKAVSGSGKAGLSSFSKKRKITNLHSSPSSSQMLGKDLGSVGVDNLVNSISSTSMLDEGLKDSGKDLISAVKVTESTETVLTAPHVKNTAVGSSKAVVKCADDSVPAGASISKKKKRKIMKPQPCSLGQLTGKPDKIAVDAVGPTKCGKRLSNLDVISLLPEHGVSPGKQKKKVFLTGIDKEAALSVQGCSSVLSTPDSTNSSKRRLNFSEIGGAASGPCSDGVLAVKHKGINLTGIVKEASQNQTSASLEDGEIDQSMNAKCSEQNNKSTEVSSSEELHLSENSDVSLCKVPITLAADTADTVVSEKSGKLINRSDANTVNDDVSKLLSRSIEVGGFPESETLKGGLSLFPAEGSLTKINRKRKARGRNRGTRNNQSDAVTLGCCIDSHLVQGKVAGSGFACPDAQLELRTGDCISMNGSEAKVSSQEAGVSVKQCVTSFPSEVVTSTCHMKDKVLAQELGSDHVTPSEICEKLAYSDALPCDAEVPANTNQVLPIPISSVEVEMFVSEIARQSNLAHYSKGLDLNWCNDAPTQVSADKELVEETHGKGSSLAVLPDAANLSTISDEKPPSSLSDSVSISQGGVTVLMARAIESQNQCTDQNSSPQEPPVVNADYKPLIINLPVKGDLSSRSDHPTLFTQSTSYDRVTNSSPMSDNLFLLDCQENLSATTATTSLEIFDVSNLNRNLDVSSAYKKSNGKSAMEAGSLSSYSKSSTLNNGTKNSSRKAMSFLPASQSAKEVLLSSINGRKKQTRVIASSKPPASHGSFVPSSGRRHATAIKSRTWRRTDNPTPNLPGQNSSIGFVPRQMQTSTQTVTAQSNSYVRKGNTLVRNPATTVSQAPNTSAPTAAVSQAPKALSPMPAVCETLRTSAPTTSVLVSQATSAPKTPVLVSQAPSAPTTSVLHMNHSTSDDAKYISCEMPERVSSPFNIDLLDCNLAPVGNSSCSPVSDSSMATENGSQRFPDDLPKSSGNSELEMIKSLEDQGSPIHSNQAASYTRKMVYIKPKSNQLVAAPNSSSEISASNKDLPACKSDVYFKRKRNQLVRATPETQADDSFNSGRRGFKSYVSRSATKKDPSRVSLKIPKSRKLSLVWKLCNTRSPKKGVNSLRCQQVLPHLLPWKRSTYQRSLFRTSADALKNSPSHKLLSTRKTHIVYKRSGFSLRRSKVVSLAGSSLKWSISLEKRSKKVDKEVKLAVAEKERREKPSIPRRRLVGSDEYVRNGNGNQLIRNLKKRTRILAREKVSWSLHTARMRLAKKRKYCQFFTRFGKCNKEEGKCPYIHDPSKNAICTKFLNGLCSDPECKLTHKVIPERMQDCSFFLQGLCSNESCPYRHVCVNPKADICGSFLQGYCAEGNECRKKHTYICPQYETTGQCPEETKCKLYHPKKGKDKNRKNTKDRNYAKGRYFDSGFATSKTEPEKEVCLKRLLPKNDGLIVEDGNLGDYISLDVSDEEDVDDQEDEACPEPDLSQGAVQPSLVFDDPDDLIKPIRLLRLMSKAAEGMA